MARRIKLKGVKKNRCKSKAGHRNRSKNKKSVVEKRRLRLSAQDTLLNENSHLQEQLREKPNIGGINGI